MGYIVFTYMANTYHMVFSLLLLAIMMCLALLGFALWHVWMVGRNYTTNESAKYSRLSNQLYRGQQSPWDEETELWNKDVMNSQSAKRLAKPMLKPTLNDIVNADSPKSNPYDNGFCAN